MLRCLLPSILLASGRRGATRLITRLVGAGNPPTQVRGMLCQSAPVCGRATRRVGEPLLLGLEEIGQIRELLDLGE